MRQQGFSLLEIVIVVAIVAIFGAIAIPRMSRGAKGSSEAALAGDLRGLRDAIERYASEHDGSYPQCAEVVGQLTRYTDLAGEIQESWDADHLYGPYLRGIPPLPVGQRKGCAGIQKKSRASDPGVGWLYDDTAGDIRANCATSEVDSAGKPYADY